MSINSATTPIIYFELLFGAYKLKQVQFALLLEIDKRATMHLNGRAE